MNLNPQNDEAVLKMFFDHNDNPIHYYSQQKSRQQQISRAEGDPSSSSKDRDLSDLSNRQLVSFLEERDVTCHGCVERAHLLAEATAVARLGLPTIRETDAVQQRELATHVHAQLTPFAWSAYDHLSAIHLTSLEPNQRVVYPAQQDEVFSYVDENNIDRSRVPIRAQKESGANSDEKIQYKR